eukprot:GHVT01008857.1.p1 GENE.GHVT01008857.1~~GHVT01008857.1.p1  ORF type:complete len:125 (-),score=18.31 GHVT01008857.1:241-615(-)
MRKPASMKDIVDFGFFQAPSLSSIEIFLRLIQRDAFSCSSFGAVFLFFIFKISRHLTSSTLGLFPGPQFRCLRASAFRACPSSASHTHTATGPVPPSQADRRRAPFNPDASRYSSTGLPARRPL